MLHDFFTNRVFFVVFFAWAFSCVLKGILVVIKEKRFDMTRFLGPGGMPSSHSAIVTCLTTCVGIRAGFGSTAFVICCVFALIVMYDATGIRRAAGEQAKMINKIIDTWDEIDIKERQIKLKEILGHTHIEVFAGAIFGILIGVIAYLWFGF